MTPERRGDLVAVACVAALITVVFLDVVINAGTFFRADLISYHFPLKRVVRDAMLSGEFPYWTRELANGQPLAANPAWELFYPPQWLTLLPDYRYGFGLHILAHFYAAGAGMYLFLRSLSRSRTAAFFGSISFALGGFLTGASSTLPTFFVWSIAPLFFWSLVRLFARHTPARFVTAALLAGLQFLVGEPTSTLQVWLLAAVGAVLYAHYRGIATRRVLTRTALLLASVAVCGLLVSAVQILPAFDHAADSIRSRGFTYQQVVTFSLPPERPLELAIANLYGSMDPGGGAFWGTARFNNGAPYFPTVYCGIAVAALALAGLLMRMRGWIVAAGTFLVAWLLSIGDATPLYRVLYDAGLRGIRYPEKFFASAIFVTIVFAAFVADRLLSGDQRARRFTVASTALLLITAAALLVPLLSTGYVASFARTWHVPPFAAAGAANDARHARILGMLFPAAFLALVALRDGISRRAWTLAAAAFLIADVGLKTFDAAPRIGREYFEAPAPVAALAPGSRLFNRGDWAPMTPGYVFAARPYKQWVARNFMRLYVPLIWGIHQTIPADYDETQLMPSHDLIDTMKRTGERGPGWSTPFAILTSTTHVMDRGDPADALYKAHGVISDAVPVIIRKVPSQPLVYLATTLVDVRAEGSAEAYLSRNQTPFATALTTTGGTASPGEVRTLVDRPARIVVRTRNAARAFLVLTQTRHKYWTALVDGIEVEIVPANLAFQGVFVPAGEHSVEFRYENPLVKAGGAITIATLLALLAYGGLYGRRPAA